MSMAQRESSSHSSSSSESLNDLHVPPLCCICDEAAAGVGPFSRQHLCTEHLSVDVADARKLQSNVKEQLRPYSQGLSAAALLEEQRHLTRQMEEAEQKCLQVQQLVSQLNFMSMEKLRARLEAVETCLRDLEDLQNYDMEVASASSSGNMSEVCQLAMSMELSLPDLAADFERSQRLRDEGDSAEVRCLWKLHRMSAGCLGDGDFSCDAAVSACTETSDAAVTACVPVCGSFEFSHEVKVDGWVEGLTFCNDTSGFVGDRSCRVVPAESAGAGSVALPQPCLIARIWGENCLTALSLAGDVRLRIHCDSVSWNSVSNLHCHRRLVFIAQSEAVTVTDVSGRVSRRISTGFFSIRGICVNDASVFVSSGNKIAAFSASSLQLEKVIRLYEIPSADLRSLTVHDNCILAADVKNGQVHRVGIDTQQLVATHPTERAGISRSTGPSGFAVDNRGRLFVSEFRSQHTVRAVSVDDWSLLWTLGVPGESGCGDNQLNRPCGLVVVTGDQCEQLVVADCFNNRLLVLNLH